MTLSYDDKSGNIIFKKGNTKGDNLRRKFFKQKIKLEQLKTQIDTKRHIT